MRIHVLDRIHEHHRELVEDDVVTAFRTIIVDAQRDDGTWMAIGLDGHGRNVEMLYHTNGVDVVIYHAFTPPTKKFLKEITRLRSKR